jgi:glycosyltransferase involved in cell wall biosynthesis
VSATRQPGPILQALPAFEQPGSSEGAITWHVITCEYPPQSGGVSDYTFLVAAGLARHGDQVHVWCPASKLKRPDTSGVQVHADLGAFSPGNLRGAGRELDRFPKPRRLLVQWVPHGFGYRSMNLAFCLWLWHRAARQGDEVELMVHEPYLRFRKWSLRQNFAAMVHRLMTLILLRSAGRIWISTPIWESLLRPYEWGRHHTYRWLPVPSNVPVAADGAAAAAIRNRYAAGSLLAGHFGTFGPPLVPLLTAIIPALLQRTSVSLLLIGAGSTAFRERLIRDYPGLKDRVSASGSIEDRDCLSAHLDACDILLQPYPDGVTTRRSTIMAALSHGRPTVTTEGALTEPFWKKSGAVALVPADDPTSFVQSAVQILECTEARKSLGEAGRELYRREFDLELTIDLLRGKQ